MSSAENKLKAATRISNQFPLLRRLSIVSLLAMLVTASVLIVLYREDQLEEHRTIAAEQNERTLVYLTHTLGDRLAEFVAAPAERRAGAVRTFDASFTAALDAFHQSDVLKLKLYTPSGIIIYSSAKSEIGGASTHPDYLARALGGETVHRIEFRDSFLGAAGRMSGVDVALTYMPLVYDGRRIGVIELYDDVTPVFKRLDDNVIRIALIVFGAFSALYVALFLAVSRTDRAVLQWQKKIAQRDDELRESQCIAGLGSYILDVASGRWESSEVLDRVLGIDAGYPRTVAGWQALLHPDEREEMIHYLENQVLAQGASFDREFRIVRRSDMAERWVHGLGRPEFDGPGRQDARYAAGHHRAQTCPDGACRIAQPAQGHHRHGAGAYFLEGQVVALSRLQSGLRQRCGASPARGCDRQGRLSAVLARAGRAVPRRRQGGHRLGRAEDLLRRTSDDA